MEGLIRFMFQEIDYYYEEIEEVRMSKDFYDVCNDYHKKAIDTDDNLTTILGRKIVIDMKQKNDFILRLKDTR